MRDRRIASRTTDSADGAGSMRTFRDPGAQRTKNREQAGAKTGSSPVKRSLGGDTTSEGRLLNRVYEGYLECHKRRWIQPADSSVQGWDFGPGRAGSSRVGPARRAGTPKFSPERRRTVRSTPCRRRAGPATALHVCSGMAGLDSMRRGKSSSEA
jgi:hypothetical protein